MADEQRRIRIRFKQESDIVVKVLRLSGPGRNGMNIHVEDLIENRADLVQIRFLTRFTKRDSQDVRIAVGMPPGLKPFIQLAMVNQQCLTSCLVDHPG